MFWIKYFNSFNRHKGFNLTKGGEGVTGYKVPIEHKNKISRVMKEWWSVKENREKIKNNIGHRHGHRPSIKREKHPQARKVKCLETGEVFNCIRDAADRYNLHDTHITAVCKGRLKTTGKKHWIYC